MNPLSMKFKNVTKSYLDKLLFEIEELSAHEGERIAIVGYNGTGKSTLLKMIHGEVKPDTGTIESHTTFSYMPQIKQSNTEFNNQMDYKLLSHFNVPDHVHLSGGEDTKLRIVEALSNYELGMLLDEPTTHLDSEGIELLIKELEYYYGTLIFVSHDRYFINNVATKIWEISNHTVHEYHGNYDDYLEQKELEKMTLKNRHENIQKEKQRLEQAAKSQHVYSEGIGHDNRKAKTSNPGRLGQSKTKDSVQKSAHKKAKAIEKRIEQLDQVDLPTEDKILSFPMQHSEIIHNKYPILAQDFSLQRGDKVLLKNVSFQFPFGKVIAITGKNGSGKSSFIHEIMNHNSEIEYSPKVKIVTYQQMDYRLDDETSIISFMMQHTELQESMVRTMLSQLGFQQTELQKSIKDISGGEATRLSLALLFVRKSNVLILDEPTNFIDVRTLEALEDFIKAYQGMVILISHDKTFIEHVADIIYRIENQKLIEVT